ncbi:hypothetical protein AC1031_019491 [Aphanomyces cochlioides]|nr:hypothetical protein AC1031_019491 [Aphanomyces cochlioides]
MWSLDETALDLVHRTWLDRPFKSGIDVLDDVFPDGIKARSVLEVYGDAESPKSLLLQHVAIAYLLHDERAQVHYFDHECMFSMELIKQMLIARNPEETGERLEKILERWTVYHCESSDDWTAQIESLNAKLLRQRDILPLIAIDCIGSFHLIDKLVHYRLQDTLFKKKVTVYNQLKDLVRQHSATVIAAKNNYGDQGWKHTEYLPPEWTSQVIKRLHVRLIKGTSDAVTYELKADGQVRAFRETNWHLYNIF